MSDLTAKFSTFQAIVEVNHEEVDASLNAILNRLDAVNVALDIITNNNATNTKLLLAAIGANSPCATCPTPPLVVPPVDDTVNPLNADKCKRVQAFLHAMNEVYTVLDTISAFSVPFSPHLIMDAISQVIDALANGDTTPLPSFPEAVNIGGEGINYAAGNFFVGDTLVGLFSPLEMALRDSLFNATSPAAVKAAFDASINSSSIPSYAKPLMTAAAYNALVSYYFDPTSTPNLTGYSGSACELTGCLDVLSVMTGLAPRTGTAEEAYVCPPPFGFDGTATLTFSGVDPYVFDEPVVWVGDAFGWTVDILVGGNVYMSGLDGSGNSLFGVGLTTASAPYTVASHTTTVILSNNLNAGSPDIQFTVRLCPPGL